MIAAHSSVRSVSGFFFATTPDQTNATTSRLVSKSLGSSPVQSLSMRLCCSTERCRSPKSFLLSCKSSRGSSGGRRSSNRNDDHDHDFLQASLLVPETMLHYRMRRQGFRENMKWQTSTQLVPYSVRTKESRDDVNSVGQDFLRRFQSPTIFLKISCDGDFLLPIIVGEFAIEKLLYSEWEEDGDDGDCPDQFQFVKNFVEKLGYEVKMVRITERVFNTYFAKLYLSKPGKKEIINVDVRPSDAINVANRCKAPIYVSKQIVLKDAVKIGYGMARVRDTKPTYDVYLDSAEEGPDLLTEELDLVRNMDRAVKEERYYDAANFRDQLLRLRKSRHDQ
ncbi:bifunctional nuclease 2-like [Melia azedarach]|uniref:Bifunctional nuclease 2-like n=1 Tax=Melia azedarach TaxID=155640 RepID=A0ACC1XRK2_MELAZ|nr:bifunctional nuclease 2-like [Melia azedarach]